MGFKTLYKETCKIFSNSKEEFDAHLRTKSPELQTKGINLMRKLLDIERNLKWIEQS